MGEFFFFFYVYLPTDWCLIWCEDTTIFESPGVHLNDFEKRIWKHWPASGPRASVEWNILFEFISVFFYIWFVSILVFHLKFESPSPHHYLRMCLKLQMLLLYINLYNIYFRKQSRTRLCRDWTIGETRNTRGEQEYLAEGVRERNESSLLS